MGLAKEYKAEEKLYQDFILEIPLPISSDVLNSYPSQLHTNLDFHVYFCYEVDLMSLSSFHVKQQKTLQT